MKDPNKMSSLALERFKSSLQNAKIKKELLKEEDNNGMLSEENIKPQE